MSKWALQTLAALSLLSSILLIGSSPIKDNALLLNQIENYKDLTNTLTQVDSLRLRQIEEYSALNDKYQLQIKSLNKDIKKKNKTLLCWEIGGITVSAGLLLFLLLK